VDLQEELLPGEVRYFHQLCSDPLLRFDCDAGQNPLLAKLLQVENIVVASDLCQTERNRLRVDHSTVLKQLNGGCVVACDGKTDLDAYSPVVESAFSDKLCRLLLLRNLG